jgi:transcriptional regulator with XRE-family HTH domain
VTDIRQVLASNMKLHRKTLGLSQSKLADKIDTATGYIAMLETGKKFPSAQMIERIAAALEIDTPELFAAAAFQPYAIEKLYKSFLHDIEKLVRTKLAEVEAPESRV